MSIANKEQFLIEFEEQERRFSPKKRLKEEEPEDDNDILEFAFKDKEPEINDVKQNPNYIPQSIFPLEAPILKNPFEQPNIFCAPVLSNNGKDRSSRNIAFLCVLVAEELKKRAQTRDELSSVTGFARQRICTVISVFKSIGLVTIKDSNTRRSEIEWNAEQAQILPNISAHTSKLFSLRDKNKKLRLKEQELLQQLKQKKRPQPSKSDPINQGDKQEDELFA